MGDAPLNRCGLATKPRERRMSEATKSEWLRTVDMMTIRRSYTDRGRQSLQEKQT